MYRALYRKWRPQRFEDVVGQKAIVTALKNQITAGRVGHAYLFTGVRGTGKTTCAKIFAKAVNCLHPENGDPCGECEVCRGIDNGSLLDVVEMDAASNNGVDDIRDLRDETAYTPSVCKYKVYIIDEVHMLSVAAFNALLKTLEEPPAHVIFILATTEIHKVPATILSRCQRYDFTRIRPEDIAGRVQQVADAEQLELTKGAANLIARLADGALRDALSILDTCAGVAQRIDEDLVRRMAGVTDRSYLFRLSDAIAAKDGAAALAELAELRQQSVDMKRLADELVGHYRNLMLAALPGGKTLLSGVSPEEEQLYLTKAERMPQAESIRAIREIGSAMEKMTRGNNQRIALELALFSLTEGPMEMPVMAVQQSMGMAQPTNAAPQTVRPFVAAPAAQAPVVSEPVKAPTADELPPWEQETTSVQAETAPKEPQAEISTDEMPPWENQPTAPQEIPEKKPVPALEEKAKPAVEKPAPGAFASWSQVVEQLQSRDPMLYPYLKNSKAYFDGRRVLIDGGNMFRDFIRANKASQRSIKKVIAEVTGLQCGIGPYEAEKAPEKTGNAEQTLEQLEQLGLDVIIKNTENSRH